MMKFIHNIRLYLCNFSLYDGYSCHKHTFNSRTREDVRQSMHRRRNPDRRQPLRERTYSLNVDHLDAQERPDVTAGPAPAANVLGTDVPTDTGVTNEVTIHGEVNYAWRTNGYTQCSLSCGGGSLECYEYKNRNSQCMYSSTFHWLSNHSVMMTYTWRFLFLFYLVPNMSPIMTKPI